MGPHHIPTITGLAAGDHLVCLYESEGEHRAVLTPFLRRGLEQGEKVVYVADAHSSKAILGYLRHDGLEVDSYLASGQLSFLSVDQAYLRGGVFDPNRMINLLRAETKRALAGGYAALRVTGEMSWAVRRRPGLERLVEYESKLAAFFPGSKCLVLCQYDRRRSSPELLLNLLAAHPFVVVGTEMCENFYYVPPRRLTGPNAVDHTVRRWLENLTSRKRAEETLRESEDRYRDLVEHSHDLICTHDLEGNILSVNQQAGTVLGCDPSDLLTKNIRDILVAEVRDEFDAYLAKIRRDGVASGLLQVQTRRGERRIWEYRNTLRNEGGAAPIVRGTAHDITERMRAEKELERTLSLLNATLESTADGIIVVDQTGKIVSYNRKFADMWRIPETVLSLHDDTLALQFVLDQLEDPEGFLRKVRQLYDTPDAESFDVLRFKDGKIFERYSQPQRVGPRCVGRVWSFRDVTERKRIEDALRQSEHEMNDFFENSPLSMHWVALDGYILRVNQAELKLLGYTREEYEGHHISEFHTDRKVAGDMLERLTGNQTLRNYQALLRCKDGSMKHVLIDSNVFWRDGTFSHTRCITRDITERKQVEAALRKSEERYRSLYEDNPTMYFTMSPEGRILSVNQFGAAQLGYTSEELVGRSVLDVVHDDDKGRVGENLKASAEHPGKLDYWEFRKFCKDGTVMWVREVARAVRTADGGIVILIVCEDITPLMEAEAAHARMAAIVESSDDAIISKTLEGLIVGWNSGAERLYGYSFEGVKDRPITILIPKDRQDEGIRILERIKRGERVDHYETVHVRRDGSQIHVSLTISPIKDGAGLIIGASSIARDITERKRAEERLHALYQAGLAIQEPLGLQERLARLLRMAREVLHVDRLNIFLADPEEQWLQAVASIGTAEPLEEIRVSIGPEGGGIARAYLTRRMMAWDGGEGPVPEELRLKPPYDRIEALRSQAFANVPLIVESRAIGVLGADRKHSRRPLDGATLGMLQLFAGQAAVAIQSARLFEQVQTGRKRFQTLSRQLVEVQEAERYHLARELHDEIGQMLTGVKLTLEMSMHSLPDAVRTTLNEAQEQLNDLIARVRTISLDLRPAMLDDLGVVPALLWHFERYTAQTSVRVEFRHAGIEGRLGPELETAVYRIVQEGLTNVARHAGVNEATVILRGDQDILDVQVKDQGRGFNAVTTLGATTSSGLAGMSERAELLGGYLTVESAPGAGTSLTVKFPMTGWIDKRKKSR